MVEVELGLVGCNNQGTEVGVEVGSVQIRLRDCRYKVPQYQWLIASYLCSSSWIWSREKYYVAVSSSVVAGELGQGEVLFPPSMSFRGVGRSGVRVREISAAERKD